MQFCASCGEQTQASPCEHCGVDPLLVGQYALRELLGQGSHGMTWRADGPDGTVAVKVINLGHSLQPEAARALSREIAVLGQLSHPQIPALVEHFTMRSGMTRYQCIVQDFVDGPSLLDELQATRHTAQQVMATVADIADILTHLHGLSPPIIHRDIKPQNIIRRADDGALVLIDFGSVRDTMVGTLGGTMSVGTVGYMPPEQITGDVRPASDVYALGALAVHLITRQPPQLAHRPDDPIRWRRPWNLPAPIGDLIDDMLRADPDRRPSSTEVARRARLAMLSGEVPIDDGDPPEPPPPRSASAESVLPTLYVMLWLFGLFSLGLSVYNVESIVGTGPLAAVFGAIVASMAWSNRLRWGALCGASAPAFALGLFAWIAGAGVSPGQAEGPVPVLIGLYLVALAVGMLRARRELRAVEQDAEHEAISQAEPSKQRQRRPRPTKLKH